MQTKDLSVGLKVAYRRYKYAEAEAVYVVATGVERQTKTNYSRRVYRGGSTVHDGVEVSAHKNGKDSFVVRPQALLQPWAEYEAARQRQQQHADEAAQREAARMKAAAEQVFALHEALVAKGVTPTAQYATSHAGEYDALLAAGFEKVEGNGFGDHVLSAVHDPDDAVSPGFRGGKVDLADVAVLLGFGPAVEEA